MVVVVLGEEVFAPVAAVTAPDGVDVIGVVLGVVVFNEEVGAGDVVVVPLAGGLGPGPGEGGGVESGGFDATPLVGGHVGGGAFYVMADEVGQMGALLALHGGKGEAGGDGVKADGAVVPGEDVGGRDGVDDGDLLLIRREGAKESAGQVFFFGEDAMPEARAVANFGGVGSEEKGKGADEVAVDDGDVNPEVMAADFESPGLFLAGLAVDGDVVELRITGEHDLGGMVEMVERFPLSKGGLEVHDFASLAGAAFAEGEVHDGQRQLPLFGLDGVEAETAATDGDVAPFVADVVVEGSLGELKLRVVERLEEGAGGAGEILSAFGRAFCACHSCPPEVVAYPPAWYRVGTDATRCGWREPVWPARVI